MKILFFIIVLVSSSISINAQNQNASRLTGTVYDPQGAVIVGAKVTAKANGKVFNTVTNSEGVYLLTIPFNPYKPGAKPARYDIIVDSDGFLTSTTKGYLFIPGYTGRMSLDIALEIRIPRTTWKRATGPIL